MPTFQLEFSVFLNELKRWKLNTNSLYRVKREEVEGYWQFSLCIPNTNEEYVSLVSKEDITEVDKLELWPLTIPAKRINQNAKLAKYIVEKLGEINATKSITDLRENI